MERISCKIRTIDCFSFLISIHFILLNLIKLCEKASSLNECYISLTFITIKLEYTFSLLLWYCFTIIRTLKVDCTSFLCLIIFKNWIFNNCVYKFNINCTTIKRFRILEHTLVNVNILIILSFVILCLHNRNSTTLRIGL